MHDCGCPIAELYAKAARERDQAAADLEELKESFRKVVVAREKALAAAEEWKAAAEEWKAAAEKAEKDADGAWAWALDLEKRLEAAGEVIKEQEARLEEPGVSAKEKLLEDANFEL